jgi:hypothetical protein
LGRTRQRWLRPCRDTTPTRPGRPPSKSIPRLRKPTYYDGTFIYVCSLSRRVGFKFRRLVLRLRGNVRLEATGETEVARLFPGLPNGVRAEGRNSAVQKLCGPRGGDGKGGQFQEHQHEETPLKTRCASGRPERACPPLWRTPPSLLSYHVCPPADKRLLHLRVSARGTEQQSSLEDDTHWPLIRPRMPRPCRTRDFDFPILRGSQFAVPSRLTSPRRNLALTNSLCARPPRCAVADRWTH